MKDHLMRNQNGRIKPSKPYLTINHSKSKSKNVKPIICSGSYNKNQTSNNIANPLKKFIDATVTQFSVKCAILVNQIESIKKEFIAQIEGIPIAFSNSDNKLQVHSLPLINSFDVHMDKKLKLFDNFQNGIEDKKHLHKMKNYTLTNSNVDRESGKETKQGNKQKIFSFKDDNDLSETEFKNDITKEKEELFLSKQENKPLSEKKCLIAIKQSHIKESLSDKSEKKSNPKLKAFYSLVQSNILHLDEKIKIKYLNHETNSNIDSKIIFADTKDFYRKQINNQIISKYSNFPSQTSIMNLNFISKELENEMQNENNKKIEPVYDLLYSLTETKKEDNYNLQQKYQNILKYRNTSSLREMLLEETKNLKENIQSRSDKCLQEYITLFNSIDFTEINKEKNETIKCISLLMFIFEEINSLFNFEIKRRNTLYVLQNELKEVNRKERIISS